MIFMDMVWDRDRWMGGDGGVGFIEDNEDRCWICFLSFFLSFQDFLWGHFLIGVWSTSELFFTGLKGSDCTGFACGRRSGFNCATQFQIYYLYKFI